MRLMRGMLTPDCSQAQLVSAEQSNPTPGIRLYARYGTPSWVNAVSSTS